MVNKNFTFKEQFGGECLINGERWARITCLAKDIHFKNVQK